MDVEAQQEWLTAVNDMSMCAYHLYQLDKSDSGFPLHIRRYIARQFEQKSDAWRQFSTGEASEFHHCAADVSATLMTKRAEVDARFLHMVQERHTNLRMLGDLDFLLSAELAKPLEMQHVSDILFTMRSIKEGLDQQLRALSTRTMVEVAHEQYHTKLVALLNKISLALGHH